MQNPINTEITSRFYEAIRLLIENKTLRGRQTYCNKAGIDKRVFYRQEKNYETSQLQLFWLIPLITEYGINAKWLLTGKGSMFDKKA